MSPCVRGFSFIGFVKDCGLSFSFIIKSFLPSFHLISNFGWLVGFNFNSHSWYLSSRYVFPSTPFVISLTSSDLWILCTAPRYNPLFSFINPLENLFIDGGGAFPKSDTTLVISFQIGPLEFEEGESSRVLEEFSYDTWRSSFVRICTKLTFQCFSDALYFSTESY